MSKHSPANGSINAMTPHHRGKIRSVKGKNVVSTRQLVTYTLILYIPT